MRNYFDGHGVFFLSDILIQTRFSSGGIQTGCSFEHCQHYKGFGTVYSFRWAESNYAEFGPPYKILGVTNGLLIEINVFAPSMENLS